MFEKQPVVSIIIPVYNGSNYMKEAIDSALAQTYENVEVIVVNDGSRDDGATESIALSYGDRIKYYFKENGGVSSALNYGISKMEGEYFSWLSHDDIYLPDKIETQINLLRQYDFDQSAVAYCSTSFIDAQSNPIRKKGNNLVRDRVYDNSECLKWALKIGCPSGIALLVPLKLMKNVGGFDERLRFSQDYLMWLKLFINGAYIVNSSRTCVCSRIHKNQFTQKGQDVAYRDAILICKFLIPQLVRLSSKKRKYLYYYTVKSSKFNYNEVVTNCIHAGIEANLFSPLERFYIMLMRQYGHIRPVLRIVYYRFIL